MDTSLDTIGGISLYQYRGGYRFSMDSVLLYSFVRPPLGGFRAADLGAGSGVVGLLLARKYPKARVALFELQEGLFGLAERNIKLNRLSSRVRAHMMDVRGLPGRFTARFDLVVSNPPFRKPLSGRLSKGEEKAIARHELKLTLPELAGAASSLLKARGRFCIVYHPSRLAELSETLRSERLEPKRMRFVHGNQGAEARMVLLEAVKGGSGGMKVEHPLVVYRPDGKYTKEVQAMYV